MIQEVVPTKGKAKLAGIGLAISGLSITFNKETVTELGLRDHVCFGTDPEQPGKLYIFKDGVYKNPLNGEKKKNGSRYVSSEDACRAGRLISGEFYPIKSDDNGKYVQSDSSEWKAPVKATRESNKAVAEKIKEKKAAEKPKK